MSLCPALPHPLNFGCTSNLHAHFAVLGSLVFVLGVMKRLKSVTYCCICSVIHV